MTTYSKLNAAVVQLDKAIELFLTGEHLCAVTLAGAAEEILGTLSRRAGKPAAVDYIVDFHGPKSAETGELVSKKEMVDALNSARNAAKHADAGGDEISISDMDAVILLMRAVPMARQLGADTEHFHRLFIWYRDNGARIDAAMK